MMFMPHPPDRPNPEFMMAEGEDKQRKIRQEVATRMPSAYKIIGILIIVAFIVMLILMNVLHLF